MGNVYYCAASLDGYIAEADGGIEWLMRYEGERPGERVELVEGGYADFYEGVGALVGGSVTYEFILGRLDGGSEWPYVGKPCWILSSRDLPVPGGDGVDVRIVAGAITELHDEMVASAGERHLWVVGGGNVASQFAEANLLDEVRVTVVPVVLGVGKPLFDPGFRAARWSSRACSLARTGWSSWTTRYGADRLALQGVRVACAGARPCRVLDECAIGGLMRSESLTRERLGALCVPNRSLEPGPFTQQ